MKLHFGDNEMANVFGLCGIICILAVCYPSSFCVKLILIVFEFLFIVCNLFYGMCAAETRARKNNIEGTKTTNNT